MSNQQQQHTSRFKITIDGTPLDDEVAGLLASAVIDDSRNLPDMFVLSFHAPAGEVITRSRVRVSSAVTIAVVSEATLAEGTDLISGEVTALETEISESGQLTVIRGYDHSHRLFRGNRTETYTNMTYADIARRLADRAGLGQGRIEATARVHPHVSQANCTDWQFLQALAAEVGYEVAVVAGKLDFHPPTSSRTGPGQPATVDTTDPLQLVHGANVLRLHAVVTAAQQVDNVQVRAWDPTTKRAVVGNAAAQTAAATVAVEPAALARHFGGGTQVATDVPYRTQSDVDNAARALADHLAGSHAELDGVARGNPRLRAGTAVRLSRLGEPFDGQYTLTSTRHCYDTDTGYTTAFSVSGRRERSLLGLTGAGPGGRARTIPGVVSAQVTDTDDPDRLGRVRLRFPWMSDSYTTDWVRTVQPGAGADRGLMVLPEVNDEVLVAFEQGDVRSPYVLGGLHNGVDRPHLGERLVDATSGAVRRRGFVSKNGHALVFLDDNGKDGIALLTGDRGARVSLNQSQTTVRIHSDGAVEINGGREVTVKAGTNLTLEATATLKLSGANVSINGQAAVEVKGNPIKLN